MKRTRTATGAVLTLVLTSLGCGDAGPTYDLVIADGRVIDPETGFFQVASVGIMGDTIAEISEEELRGARVIDATGMVVAPDSSTSTSTVRARRPTGSWS